MFGCLFISRGSKSTFKRTRRTTRRHIGFESLETRDLLAGGGLLGPINGLQTSEAGRFSEVSVLLTAAPTADVTISLVSDNQVQDVSPPGVSPTKREEANTSAIAINPIQQWNYQYSGVATRLVPADVGVPPKRVSESVSGQITHSIYGGEAGSPQQSGPPPVSFIQDLMIGGRLATVTFSGSVGPPGTAMGNWTATFPFDPKMEGNGIWTAKADAPKINQTPGGDVVPASGGSLTDAATISGAYYPGGVIAFTLQDSHGRVVYQTGVPVKGNGSYSASYRPSLEGAYYWSANYSGDSYNQRAASGSVSEWFGPATPTLSASTGGTVILGSGAKLTESVRLADGYKPTGNITFVLYAPDKTTVLDAETVPVNGNRTYSTPNGYLPSTPGSYLWVVSYNSGDHNNYSVQGKPQPERVDPASPTLDTTPGGNVVPGSGAKLTDSGVLVGGFNPTGTMTFTLYGPNNKVVQIEPVPVDGNGTYSTPNGYLPSVNGIYKWVVSYSGDGNNNGVTSLKEPETVGPATPTITATPSGPIVLDSGARLTNSVIISAGYNPKGTITFTLYGPNNKVVHTETADVNDNGSYVTSNGYVPGAAGTYQWVTSYSGDRSNKAVGTKKGQSPVAVIPASPTIVVSAGGPIVLGSGAKLVCSATVAGGYNPTGTIKFALYDTNNKVLATETVKVKGNGTYSTPKGFLPKIAGAYRWVVTYSGAANNNGVSDSVSESANEKAPGIDLVLDAVVSVALS